MLSAIVTLFRSASNVRVTNLQLAMICCGRLDEPSMESVLCKIFRSARRWRVASGCWVYRRHSTESMKQVAAVGLSGLPTESDIPWEAGDSEYKGTVSTERRQSRFLPQGSHMKLEDCSLEDCRITYVHSTGAEVVRSESCPLATCRIRQDAAFTAMLEVLWMELQQPLGRSFAALSTWVLARTRAVTFDVGRLNGTYFDGSVLQAPELISAICSLPNCLISHNFSL